MRRWKGVVLHHTAGRRDASASDIDHMHRTERGFRAIGYNYLVRYNSLRLAWEVQDGRPLTMDGAHCPGANKTHIGVAVAGDYCEERVPEHALSVLVMLLTDLCVTHGIATKDIIPHSDRRPTECPGDQMRAKLVSIRERVESLLPIAGAI